MVKFKMILLTFLLLRFCTLQAQYIHALEVNFSLLTMNTHQFIQRFGFTYSKTKLPKTTSANLSLIFSFIKVPENANIYFNYIGMGLSITPQLYTINRHHVELSVGFNFNYLYSYSERYLVQGGAGRYYFSNTMIESAIIPRYRYMFSAHWGIGLAASANFVYDTDHFGLFYGLQTFIAYNF